jgi:uncharacterized protein Smg (DUF494 family)
MSEILGNLDNNEISDDNSKVDADKLVADLEQHGFTDHQIDTILIFGIVNDLVKDEEGTR